MKKLTLLMMACCMALFAYAQPWTITYVLPSGAVTNPYGWQSKSDMFDAFAQDHNPELNWGPLSAYQAAGAANWGAGTVGDYVGFGVAFAAGNVLNNFTNHPAKWGWLRTYLVEFVGSAGSYPLNVPEPHANGWRANFVGFWGETHRTAYPASANFLAGGGAIEAFQSTWKMGFQGPAEYVAANLPITIPAPFLAEHTFLGWFTEPNGAGTRMNTIPAGRTGNLTLYAHFGTDPIYTAADIAGLVASGDLAVGDEVNSIGVVTFVAGNTIYIQSAIDGSAMTVSFATLPASVTVGRELLVKGKITALGTAYVLTEAVIVWNDAGTLPPFAPLDDFMFLDANKFRYVQLQGLTVTAIDGNNVTVRDRMGNTATLVAALPTGVTVNGRISIIGVVSYDGTDTGLLASTSNIELTTAAVPDPSTYEPITIGGVDFSLRGKWLVANERGNYAANAITAAQASRGMVAKNGRMYFPDRVDGGISNYDANHGIVVIDAATGARLDRISFRDSDVFRNASGTPLANSFNDLKLDCAGNFVSSTLTSGLLATLQIWVLDMDDITESRMLLNTTIGDELREAGLPAFEARIDYIDVFGDVNGNAIIMAAGGNSSNVFRWWIEDGEVVWFQVIALDFNAPGTTIYGLTTFTTAVYIHIVDEELFFVDSMNDAPSTAGVPILFDDSGQVVDGFHAIVDTDVRTAAMPHAMPVGLTEFSVSYEGEEYHFLVTAHGHTASPSSPVSSFQLLKYADAGKDFAHLTPMWVFPGLGMGGGTNPGRSAVPSVTVDGNVATIHLWYVDIGYAVFEFVVGERPGSGIPQNPANALVNMFVEGNRVTFDQEVSQVSVFSVTGQLVTTGISSTEISIPATGVFLVRVVTLDGQTAVERVIIR